MTIINILNKTSESLYKSIEIQIIKKKQKKIITKILKKLEKIIYKNMNNMKM